MLSASAFAQTTTPPAGNGQPGQDGQRPRGRRQFTVNINNTSKNIELDTVQKAELIQIVKDVYVPFAQADGTRVRGFSFSVNDSLQIGMIAKVGKISVSGDWLKKNYKNFATELQTTLRKNWHSVDTVKKADYQLVFINKNSDFSPEVRKNLIDAYFKVYPVLVSKFNDKSTHNVIFITDTAYKGVAECSGNRILFSTKYMNQNPYDIDIVTHEGMHIVQGYPGGAGPGWLTEGIADYIRYKYGVDNIGSRWTLPEFKNDQSYKDAYRVTARFFEWIEQKVKPDVIMTIDQQLRTKTYTEESWAKLTGKTVDELWADYAKNPQVDLKYSGKAPVKKG
ncbi:hypothetical protein GCM10028827_35700 [Mucilaginibacter myungsuensis]|uniref:Secretory protein n=2 Tax=Mucilaginibacter myungsuensis TaxID=649104 RepID=A0A929L3R0_9SPHI|nr:secretory protein [Mucilaginibacter myungsuensis]